jgi:ABC-type transport system substrate-binding protein
MRKRKLGFVLAAGLLVAACGVGNQASPTGPKQAGTLHVAIGIDPDTLDPAQQTTTTVSQIVDMVDETLVTIDRNGKVAPLLATSWTNSSDGLSYTFTLRSGVKFHDGSDFNADAVKFSIDRLLSSSTLKAQPGVLRAIKETQVVDATHVKFMLSTPLAPFVAAMTQTQAAIISPKSVNVEGNTPANVQVPVGTGPYKWKERVKGDHITLVRNESYWGQKPSYATQELKVVPDAASREALVKAGQEDVIALPPASDLNALKQDSNVKVLLGTSDRTIQIIINTIDPKVTLLQNPTVRQALNYAIDKNSIIQKVLFGAAVPLDSPMSKVLFGYCRVGAYDYDPNKAKQMLGQAGATGMSVKLVSPTGRYVQDIQAAQAVAGYLRDAGLNVNGPGTSDWPSYLATVNVSPDKASTDLHLLGWAPPYLDASQQMEQFYSPRIPPAGLETSYYKNPEVDALVTKANAEPDQTQREKDYCAAQKQIWNDAPWIFLYNQRYPIVTSSKVTGIYTTPIEKFVTSWASPA